jgi:serine phosphatase RsbU (regulator of sigma subunit)/pSer/pThr/pTyr-binding forkhead associated (FHA) protein
MLPEIVVRTSDGQTKSLRLEKDRLTLGRSSSNDLSYPEDHGLSRNHLLVERIGRDWQVIDLNSKNGTLVNGIKITAPTKLEPGYRISAGHLVISFAEPSPSVSNETVVFVEGGLDTPSSSTVITSLEGLSRKKESESDTGTALASSEARRTAAFAKASAELSAQRSVDDLFRVIMEQALEAVGATRGVLMTLEGEEKLTVREARGEGFKISSSVRDKVVRERQSLLVRDTQLGADWASQSIVDASVRSFMAVPLQTQDKVLGLIYLDSSTLKEFAKDDLELMTRMANIAAIRIDAARVTDVEAELNRAAVIQRGLLPSAPPNVPGVELAGYNSPCRTVGGDYYDFFAYPDGRVALIVADVAGKGMSAAMLMSSLQARVQVLAEEPSDLAAMVTRLNSVVAKNCPANRFITFFICVLDPASGEVKYCNAGHNPPVLVRAAGGNVETLAGGGVILGILPKAQYSECTTHMEPGDVLILFSDGVTEAMKAGEDEEFGEERLAEVAVKNPNLNPAQLIVEINRAVSVWSAGASPADDVTLVVARRKG